jgi:hypothetical protein
VVSGYHEAKYLSQDLTRSELPRPTARAPPRSQAQRVYLFQTIGAAENSLPTQTNGANGGNLKIYIDA